MHLPGPLVLPTQAEIFEADLHILFDLCFHAPLELYSHSLFNLYFDSLIGLCLCGVHMICTSASATNPRAQANANGDESEAEATADELAPALVDMPPRPPKKRKSKKSKAGASGAIVDNEDKKELRDVPKPLADALNEVNTRWNAQIATEPMTVRSSPVPYTPIYCVNDNAMYVQRWLASPSKVNDFLL
jgi:hypothetical protein